MKEKTCYCHTCERAFHWLGINRHRAMHRDKREDCDITYTYGDRYIFEFSKLEKSTSEDDHEQKSSNFFSSRWGRLRLGNIVGVVDSYGAVHSEFTGNKIEFHADHFPQHICQWRWNHEKSIWWTTQFNKPNKEQYSAIQQHLTKKYGLQWWENGHHDIDHLQSKWREESNS